MVVKKSSDFDWLFGGKKKRKIIRTTAKPLPKRVEPEIELAPVYKRQVTLCNPRRLDDLGNPYRFFEDIDLKKDEPYINEKIKDYREEDD